MNRNRASRIKHPCNEGLCLQGVREMTRRGGGRGDAAAVPRAVGAGVDLAGAPSRAESHVPILHLCPDQPAPGDPWITAGGNAKPQVRQGRKNHDRGSWS